jgi:hypothetical protein
MSLGVGFAVILTMIFFWKEWSGLSTNLPVNDGKISSYGSILSGLVGTCWSLASVILFYVALTEQRKDMAVNKEALGLQTDALRQQIKEFELQTKELEETRKVYSEQLATQTLQRFESSFYQMLNLHHNIVNSMTFRSSTGGPNRIGRDCFKTFNTLFKKECEAIDKTSVVKLVDAYLSFYDNHEDALSHYFRNLYHIFKFVDTSSIKDKKFYTALVRAQLSSNELLLLIYNCLSPNGLEKFKPIIERYSLLKNVSLSDIEGGRLIITQYKATAYGRKDFESILKGISGSSIV